MKYDKFIQIFSLITLCVLFGLIFMGGYVSSSNVGLSCPKWPLCPKGLIPSPEFLIEYTHRSIAATTGLLVFLNMIFILKAKSALKSTKIFSILAAGAVFGQIFLGGVVITEKLHALLVTGHLGLGLILYSSLIYVVLTTFYTNSKIKTFSSSSSLASSLSPNSVGKRKSSSKFFNNFGL